MCKNNFTNENEFDFYEPLQRRSESVCNPCGPSNLGDVIIIIFDQ